MKVNDIRELSLTSTSKGMLYKCIGNINGKKVYIKTGAKLKNKFSILEPISEAIAYEIINKFNIPCAVNYIQEMKLPILERDVLVNVSEDFLQGDESLMSIRNILGNSSREELYNKVVELIPQFRIDIDRMIVMDFLINNIDRHLRNFSVIVKEGKVIRFAPLYDHGLSIYADIQDFELEQDDKENWEMIDECKPFCESHYEQLELISDVNLPTVKIEDILDIIDKYKEHLSLHRIECIKFLLEKRYNYLLEKGIL
ncbi:HipA domain-containing protein [Clostridium algidicarnis]|uniref:HipA domain-containing protein n=1 Tax=Clostridium algidicarnis TaxID=37659 RepID=UPI001C0D1CBD|nr:HipA domain-containing protein [Clostridium algidicarnis]MBU3204385.1 HipA domain-containing protein [Clostridium algidicarnis]MBU3212531.1 HipA domain-containing protein [Clostridium algidicarnis]MBU3222962.1 HipA domain-containing protein [Clostridium algidicarnis]